MAPRWTGMRAAIVIGAVQFRTLGGGLSAAVALGVWLLGAAAREPEPGLIETQEAAAKVAGGSAAQDASRAARARAAHWAPQLRAHFTGREDEKLRAGEYRLAPLREQDSGAGRSWLVMLTWDLSQVVFAREESQVALASAQLARVRKEAVERAAQLWIERRLLRAQWMAARARDSCFALLRATAALVAVTGGTLFRDQEAHEEAACTGEGG
jgi:hypothetical protein